MSTQGYAWIFVLSWVASRVPDPCSTQDGVLVVICDRAVLHIRAKLWAGSGYWTVVSTRDDRLRNRVKVRHWFFNRALQPSALLLDKVGAIVNCK